MDVKRDLRIDTRSVAATCPADDRGTAIPDSVHRSCKSLIPRSPGKFAHATCFGYGEIRNPIHQAYSERWFLTQSEHSAGSSESAAPIRL
jgi:hypothetical protein